MFACMSVCVDEGWNDVRGEGRGGGDRGVVR